MKSMCNVIAIGLLAITSHAWAAPNEAFKSIQADWAEAMYRQSGNTREKQLEALSEKARNVVADAPKDADALIWEGIVISSYAGAKGGLGALGLVKEAKAAFEKAIGMNPKAMDGSAYTSLGSLYYQVPGWPLGFGNDEKAEEFLKKGLAINPNGIDPNYFYGDFLYRQARYPEAERALVHALEAPARPGRELADEGRRGEIQTLLGKVRAKKA